jgi:hypothetical protein
VEKVEAEPVGAGSMARRQPNPLAKVALKGELIAEFLGTPWKYGFKGIKSIVKIRLTETQPPSTWNFAAPNEYGFYANVNPDVDHPRWSQATERRIGD